MVLQPGPPYCLSLRMVRGSRGELSLMVSQPSQPNGRSRSAHGVGRLCRLSSVDVVVFDR